MAARLNMTAVQQVLVEALDAEEAAELAIAEATHRAPFEGVLKQVGPAVYSAWSGGSKCVASLIAEKGGGWYAVAVEVAL